MPRFLLLILLLITTSQVWGAPVILKKNETWSGKIQQKGDVTVPENVTVTIQPGAEITFPSGAGLIVQGRLLANGSAKSPIIFRSTSTESKPGLWRGLLFEQGSRDGSELLNVRIENATNCILLTGAKVHIADSVLRNSNKGIITGVGAFLLIEHSTISNMSEGGIEASVGSQGKVTSCQIRNVTTAGIQIDKKSTFLIRDNQVSNAKVGIFISGESPPVEGNRVDHCEAGIVILQASPATIIRSNQVADCKSGIACHQFASPTIEKNGIERCELGIDCFQASSPMIRQNLLSQNKRGISGVQMCNPAVSHNDFKENQTAIYLHLSSYAQIHENNFEGDRLHIELDNMSSDWEVRAKKKPTRSREKQSELLATKERANPMDFQVEAGKEGYVNAKENYWGKVTTAEMASKGDNANISTIQDAYDVPTRTYDGWPGEYQQDRVNYSGWKKKRVANTFTP